MLETCTLGLASRFTIYTERASLKLHKSCSTLLQYPSWALATVASTEQSGWWENYWDTPRIRGTAVVPIQDLWIRRSRNGSCDKYEHSRQTKRAFRSKPDKQRKSVLIKVSCRCNGAHDNSQHIISTYACRPSWHLCLNDTIAITVRFPYCCDIEASLTEQFPPL